MCVGVSAGMVIKDPNDGVTDKFWYSTEQSTAMTSISRDRATVTVDVKSGDAAGLATAATEPGQFFAGSGFEGGAAGDGPAVMPKAKAKARL